jgi:nitrogen-specific signal transduction histidine kinase
MKKALAKIVIGPNAVGVPASMGAASRAEAHPRELRSSNPDTPPRRKSQQAARKVAHDLQNPISGILAATQYLIEDAGPILADHHLTALHAIEASGFRLLRLIDTLVLGAGAKPSSKRPDKQMRAGSASSGTL